jgi:5-methylcytosine-specific restriction enzyme subunit McrC
MRAAVDLLSRIARAPGNQRRLAELTFAFADVSVIPINQLPWDRVILDRTNMAWTTLLKFAKLLLSQRFQTTSTGYAPGFSLLFEMNTLFEEYVGRTLRRVLVGSGLDVHLQGPRDHALSRIMGHAGSPPVPTS